MADKGFQTNYSEVYAHKTDYDQSRDIKAEKTLAVLKDAASPQSLSQLKALEIGCYKGAIAVFLATNFQEFHAFDIDEKAVAEAKKEHTLPNLFFDVQNAEDLQYEDGSFDVVICSHVYEHVPHPDILMKEVRRVLKPGGFCYFAAGNKIRVIEPHYRLPFLSCVPKKLAHWYLKLSRKGNYYYESLFTYWQLKKLVSEFSIRDYSEKIIKDPEAFSATDMMTKGSKKQQLALWMYKNMKALFPTYIWILEKSK